MDKMRKTKEFSGIPDVISIGEILADFVPRGSGHELCPGGAPSNVAVNLSRAGIKSAVIGKLGDDFLGRFLLDFLAKNRVNTENVRLAAGKKTGLVFVFLDKNGERDFTFYGKPSADGFLNEAEIKASFIKKAKILHFGSISMMAPDSRRATLKAVKLAKKYGLLVSFDPNVRLNLWKGRYVRAREEIKQYFKYADIIKISDTELKFIFDAPVSSAAVTGIFSRKKLVVVSMGKKGCFICLDGKGKKLPAVKVKPVDTTGAGDAFMAGVLAGIIRKQKGLGLTCDDIKDIAVLANKMGAKAVRRKGAV